MNSGAYNHSLGIGLVSLVAAAVFGLVVLFLSSGATTAPNARDGFSSVSSTANLVDTKARYRRPEAVPFPADNPYSEAKARLGQKLFFDPRLSADGNFACAT